MPTRPLVLEAHRRVGKNCRDRRRQFRRSAQKVRQTVPREPCRSLTLGASSSGSHSYRFTDARRFSPGPSMIIRSTQTPTDLIEPKDDFRTLEPGAWQAEDRRRWNAITIIALSDQPTEGDRRAGRKQH